jgi:hypothetical protein
MVVQDRTTRIPSKLQVQFVSNFQISMSFLSIYLLLNVNIICCLSFAFIRCRYLVDKLWQKSPIVIETFHLGAQSNLQLEGASATGASLKKYTPKSAIE